MDDPLRGKLLKGISVVGLGFVGVSTAVHFASHGYPVIGSSNHKEKVKLIGNGIVPFFEPELEPMLNKVLRNRKLTVVLGRETAVLNTDISFIAVGTPSLSDGSADLTFVNEAAKEIGMALKRKRGYHLVVVRSTVPPGTSENVVKTIIEKYSEKKVGEDFGLAMSPEFLREGFSLYDLANPDRIVIGEFDERSGSLLEELNKELYKNKVPILRMSLASAELAKYASNAFLATKISFINQMANICERISEVNVVEIASAMGLDPRIGEQFLRAGAGWGGSCLPKDTKALVAFSRNLGYRPRLLEEAISINIKQVKRMVEFAEEELGDLEGKRISILGLSFKPNTNDIREATSLKVIELLLSKGARVTAFDPVANDKVKEVLGDRISYARGANECLQNADCCMLVTEWDEFKKLEPSDFTKLMHKPVLIDGRRIYNPEKFSKKLRLRAIGLGRFSEGKV